MGFDVFSFIFGLIIGVSIMFLFVLITADGPVVIDEEAIYYRLSCDRLGGLYLEMADTCISPKAVIPKDIFE